MLGNGEIILKIDLLSINTDTVHALDFQQIFFHQEIGDRFS